MILLDTDVLVNLRRKHPPLVDQLERLWEEGEELGTTSLNAAEFLRGGHGDHERLAMTVEVLEGLNEVPFGPRAARRFGRLMDQLDRAGAPVPVVDGMIAAVALEEGARVMTGNVRHFERVAGLELMAPADGEADEG